MGCDTLAQAIKTYLAVPLSPHLDVTPRQILREALDEYELSQ